MLKKGIYKDHYGVLFRLIGEGQSTDGSEILVIYQEMYGDQRYFVCKVDDFNLTWTRER